MLLFSNSIKTKFEDFFNINPEIIFGIYTVSHKGLIAKLKAYGFDNILGIIVVVVY